MLDNDRSFHSLNVGVGDIPSNQKIFYDHVKKLYSINIFILVLSFL